MNALKRFECRACKNWRTTGAGVAAVLAAVADIINQVVNKDWDAARFGADITGLFTGIGLIFARDAIVSEQEHHVDRVAIAENTENAVVAKQAAVVAAKEAVAIRDLVESKP